MHGYGQFCPVAQAMEVVGDRWTLLVVRELLSGSRRFNQIHRGVPLISPTLLSQRLRALERAGIVERGPAADTRASEYHLTPAGEELRPVVEGLGVWGRRWAGRDASTDHLDPGLLMWDLRRRIEFSQVPARRVVVQFHYHGVPRGKAWWWLVLDRGGADLCLTDPGFGVDVWVEADLLAFTMVWMGDTPLADAVASGEVRIEGDRQLVRGFAGWLRLSVFAGVDRPPRPVPRQASRTPAPEPTTGR